VDGDGFDDVVVGAIFNSPGVVLLFRGSASGIANGDATTAYARLTSTRTGYEMDTFGTSVASAGDVNGDGFGDVIVGAALDDYNPGSAAFVYTPEPDALLSLLAGAALIAALRSRRV